MKKKKVSVLVPAHNEEGCIEKTLQNLKFDWIKEIIVINDGSTDNTLNKAAKFNIKLINIEKNVGKGKAIEQGLKNVTGEIIVLVDADTGESVIEIEKLVKPILKGEVELTIGILPVNGGGLGLVRGLARTGLKILTNSEMEVPLSGQRAFVYKIKDKILPLSSGFGLEIGMDIDILKHDIKYKEIKCNFRHAVTGHTLDGYIHRGKQFWSILRTLWQKRSLRV